ncbi:hypothetical protein D3C81_2136610 [compost metagenome]
MPAQPPLIVEQVAAQTWIGNESGLQSIGHGGGRDIQFGHVEVTLQVGSEADMRHERLPARQNAPVGEGIAEPGGAVIVERPTAGQPLH